MSATGADWRVEVGDCIERMAAMPAASVDAIVTDPPYGLEFMGKEWDRFAPSTTTAGRGNGGSTARNPDDPAGRHGRSGTTPPSTRRCLRCGGWTGTFSEARRARQRECTCPQGADLAPGAPSSLLAFQSFSYEWAREALRVLKPGGHLLAFGGTRTYHRLACAIEDAGFEIRDTIAWLYGSGFPKSLDVGKAIDKAAGAEREVVGSRELHGNAAISTGDKGGTYGVQVGTAPAIDVPITAPATPDAQAWDGWGTALKPAHEPIVVARKPLAGTVAGNVQAHGTGALNIDGCRIGTGNGGTRDGEDSAERRYTERGGTNFAPTPGPRGGDPAGRWPANVALDPEAARLLDAQTGELHGAGSAQGPQAKWNAKHTEGWGNIGTGPSGARIGDSGGASRFFYVAKASSAERNAGLDGFEEREARDTYGDGLQGPRPHTAPDYEWQRRGARNSHPTVKPVQLMRWLCRLVTPPGGLILDPFAGSGTTGAAAVLEGFDFVGIEREEEYARIAEARIAWWAEHPEGVELVARLEAERERRDTSDAGQAALFA